MTICDDGTPLEAVLERPEKQSDNTPLMILIHGFTGYKEEPHLNAMAEMMTGLGFAVLRPDLYGHGKSGGHFRDHTIFKWLANITVLIDYARKELPYREIWLAGHSQGGLAVMLAAAMHRDRIKGVVALAPALTIPTWAREGRVHGIFFDPARVPEEFEVGEPEPLSGNYVRAAQLIHPEDSLLYDGPILFVHGDADETIPVGISVEYAGRFRDAELAVIPGGSHCYDYHLDEAVAAVRDWLKRKM